MPLNIKGGSGISVQSSNASHTLTITNTATPNTHNGSYNTTQANNVNINSGGYKINFINGTGATVYLQNSGSGNQVNVTVSATGTSSGVSSLNALTGALTIACVSGNTTCTTSGGNTITVNTAYNVVVTNGAAQTITKGITHTADLTMSGANINMGTNIIKTTNYNFNESNTVPPNAGILLEPKARNSSFTINFAANGIPASKTSFIGLYRTLFTTSNYERLLIGSDLVGSNEYAIKADHGVSGSYYPIDLYIDNTKEMSIDVANTITHYVDTLFKTKITQYNSINTAGWGVPAIYASVSQLSVSGSGTILSYTPPATSGIYKVHIAMDIHQPSSSPVTVGWNMTDQNPFGIHFADIAQPEFCTSSISGSTAYSFSVAASNIYCSGETNINIDNTATPIIVKFKVYSGTLGGAVISSWIERVG